MNIIFIMYPTILDLEILIEIISKQIIHRLNNRQYDYLVVC